jgi:hypothetical protein
VIQEIYSSTTNEGQPPSRDSCPLPARPFRAALLCALQLKLLLRRARAQEIGCQKSECLNRLLDGSERICASLEWLDGRRHEADATQSIPLVEANLVSTGGLQ